jgi:GH25 family lysozyme M1 (1,4-beta-N-acetylmuramidase)
MQPGAPDNAFGVDVSEFQGHPDWRQVKDAGRVFAYARVTYGAAHVDAAIAYNWPSLHDAGLWRGAYHVAVLGETSADVQVDASHQAARFLAVLDALGGIEGYDLPPALDLEPGSNPRGYSPTEVVAWATQWMDDVDAAVKNPRQHCLLYSDEAFLAALGEAAAALGGRGLWIARWNPFGSPPNVGPWGRWTCWQYSSTGSVSGIAGPVDLDEWDTGVSGLPPLADPCQHLADRVRELEGRLAELQRQAPATPDTPSSRLAPSPKPGRKRSK